MVPTHPQRLVQLLLADRLRRLGNLLQSACGFQTPHRPDGPITGRRCGSQPMRGCLGSGPRAATEPIGQVMTHRGREYLANQRRASFREAGPSWYHVCRHCDWWRETKIYISHRRCFTRRRIHLTEFELIDRLAVHSITQYYPVLLSATQYYPVQGFPQ